MKIAKPRPPSKLIMGAESLVGLARQHRHAVLRAGKH